MLIKQCNIERLKSGSFVHYTESIVAKLSFSRSIHYHKLKRSAHWKPIKYYKAPIPATSE